MYSVKRQFRFEAGHRVLGHKGKCASLHGHSWIAEVEVKSDNLDDLGMVVDFGFLKDTIGRWIDEKWDHTMILHQSDPLLDWPGLYEDGLKVPYVMSNKRNPTSEGMAVELFYGIGGLMLNGIWISSVKIRETENCTAEYTHQPSVGMLDIFSTRVVH